MSEQTAKPELDISEDDIVAVARDLLSDVEVAGAEGIAMQTASLYRNYLLEKPPRSRYRNNTAPGLLAALDIVTRLNNKDIPIAMLFNRLFFKVDQETRNGLSAVVQHNRQMSTERLIRTRNENTGDVDYGWLKVNEGVKNYRTQLNDIRDSISVDVFPRRPEAMVPTIVSELKGESRHIGKDLTDGTDAIVDAAVTALKSREKRQQQFTVGSEPTPLIAAASAVYAAAIVHSGDRGNRKTIAQIAGVTGVSIGKYKSGYIRSLAAEYADQADNTKLRGLATGETSASASVSKAREYAVDAIGDEKDIHPEQNIRPVTFDPEIVSAETCAGAALLFLSNQTTTFNEK